MTNSIDYDHIRKIQTKGRLLKKLETKQKSKAQAEENAPSDGQHLEKVDTTPKVVKALEEEDKENRPETNGDVPEGKKDDAKESDAATAQAAMKAILEEQERIRKKEESKHAVTEDMKQQANKVCKVGAVKVTTADGSGTMTNEEKARLNSAVGNGKAQAVRAWTNAEGQDLVIDESVLSKEEGAKSAVVFSGCKGCRYVLKVYCAKVFVRGCSDTEIIIDQEARLLTQTLEVEYSQRIMMRVHSRVCTFQVEQCSGIIVDVSKREYFGNGSLVHREYDYGHDGMLIWAGCDDLRLRVGEDVLVCDYALEASLDKTLNKERTQFKVHYNSLNTLISEKVTRLINGFPSTAREEEEFNRKENAKLQDVAQRMGVSIRRKEDVIGNRVKPNETCPCGSGKKFKKCCKT